MGFISGRKCYNKGDEWFRQPLRGPNATNKIIWGSSDICKYPQLEIIFDVKDLREN